MLLKCNTIQYHKNIILGSSFGGLYEYFSCEYVQSAELRVLVAIPKIGKEGVDRLIIILGFLFVCSFSPFKCAASGSLHQRVMDLKFCSPINLSLLFSLEFIKHLSRHCFFHCSVTFSTSSPLILFFNLIKIMIVFPCPHVDDLFKDSYQKEIPLLTS